MATSKTPVTILQEISMKQRGEHPIYDYIGEVLESENNKVFTYNVKAFGLEVTGQGRNKKDAKHNTAAELLKQLAKQINDPQFTVPDSDSKKIQNAVGDLLDLCVVRKYPIAEFNTISARGPSHAPEFTVECKISKIVKSATASTKKGAKQLAATKMLEVIQEMAQPMEHMQISKINDKLPNDEEDQDRIDTYLKYKLADNKKTPLKLCDRHLFFSNIQLEKKLNTGAIFCSDIENELKVDALLNGLGLKYEIKDCPYLKGYSQFELIKCDYDCLFIEGKNNFYPALLSYLKTMVNF